MQKRRPTVLLGTRNWGKVREFADMLAELAARLVDLNDAGIDQDIPETGSSLRQNAVLKAEGYARASGLLTLADDTGLEVDALGGAPGIFPARFGGPELTPEQRYRLLLRRLEGVPWPQRTARFRCVVALAGPDGLIAATEGVCAGIIALEPGTGQGFGYDPVFFVPQFGQTLAQLPASLKNRISHRGQAVQALIPLLRQALEQ